MAEHKGGYQDVVETLFLQGSLNYFLISNVVNKVHLVHVTLNALALSLKQKSYGKRKSKINMESKGVLRMTFYSYYFHYAPYGK